MKTTSRNKFNLAPVIMRFLFLAITVGLFSVAAPAQYAEDTYDKHPTTDAVSIEREEEMVEMAKVLQAQIERTDEALKVLDKKRKELMANNQMTENIKQSMDDLELTLEMIKTGLTGKMALIDDQPADEWETFKKTTYTWSEEVERQISYGLQNLHEDLAEISE
ncbi:MAG: hypothetical protein HUJ25_15975 [Crocinitomicaceae bacterium]|nr:hypothetical protein [Crocinitomicaceae bacterium]